MNIQPSLYRLASFISLIVARPDVTRIDLVPCD